MRLLRFFVDTSDKDESAKAEASENSLPVVSARQDRQRSGQQRGAAWTARWLWPIQVAPIFFDFVAT